MIRTARRARVPPTQLAAERRAAAGIGHNGGPPLDNSGTMFLWRRAVNRAWKTPPREVALARLRQAEALGLSYREFAAILMDRGQRLSGAIFMIDDRNRLAQATVVDRLQRLGSTRALVCARGRDVVPLPASIAESIDAVESVDEPGALDSAITAFLERFNLSPGAVFMVGTRCTDLATAERHGLALFKWAASYFALSTPKSARLPTCEKGGGPWEPPPSIAP